ncbi:MAG: nucleotidyltransferase family protein [Ornithinibacter sp.]
MISTVGLLLAAGAGRRMGGPKALLRLHPDGPTRVETGVAQLRSAGLDRVVVVVGAGAERAGPLAEAAGAEVVREQGWSEGMGASLRAGLTHLRRSEPVPSSVLVTLVDLPDVGEAVYRRVLGSAGSPDVLARAAYEGSPGHPVLLGMSHWDAVLESAIGDRGARGHLESHDVELVECGDLATGRDVDTAADLERG